MLRSTVSAEEDNERKNIGDVVPGAALAAASVAAVAGKVQGPMMETMSRSGDEAGRRAAVAQAEDDAPVDNIQDAPAPAQGDGIWL